MVLVLFLSFPLFYSFDSTEIYNITIGNQYNFTNLSINKNYQFHIEINNPPELNIKIFPYFPNKNIIEYHKIYSQLFYITECESDLSCGSKEIFGFHDYKFSYSESKNCILIAYEIKNNKTKKILLEFCPNFNLNIKVDLGKTYNITTGVINNFTDILDSFTYHFFVSDIKRFQRINITIITKQKGWWYDPFKDICIKEFKTGADNYNSYIYKNITKMEGLIIRKWREFTKYSLIYDIKIGSIISFRLKPTDLDYLIISLNIKGDNIYEFDDNHITKNLVNLKSNLPYYFLTKISQYQTAIITFINKYSNYIAFEYADIYEYENKNNLEFSIINKEHFSYRNIDNDKVTLKFSYKEDNLNITYLSFRIEFKYEIEYMTVKIDIIDGPYYLNNGDNKIYRIIKPGYDIYFWIKISQFQKLTINLNFNYFEKNLFNYIDIYEYNYYNFFNNYYKHQNRSVIIEKKDNKELFTSLSYIAEYQNINYVLLKISPKYYNEYLKINVIIDEIVYHFINNIPKNITNIKYNNKYYFFINATKFNKVFALFTLKDKNCEIFKYITINEYEKENNLSYIKSSNYSFEKIKNENEIKINISYTPLLPSTKYIAFIIAPEYNIDYLFIQIDVGGGYYEFNNYKNITKIIAGSIYYFAIKISIFKKIIFNITMNDINETPFIYANIYEKINLNENISNKYHNQTLTNNKYLGKIIKSFNYSIDDFSTNAILIELIPNINLEYIFIEYEITNNYYELSNGESKNFTGLLSNNPYYYCINSKQFEQINFNLITNYLNNKPIEYVEFYELKDKHFFSSYNKYINKTIQLTNNQNNILNYSFSQTIDSVYTTCIIMKIKLIYKLEYFNIKINIGGGALNINKGVQESILNLLSGFSYYFFVISSKGEKLNYKLEMESDQINKPFNSLNIYEYSHKNSTSIFSENTIIKFDKKIKNNKLIYFFSYITKSNTTNFIGLKIIPNYDINLMEYLVEEENEEINSNSISFEKILIIILVIIIIITIILLFIYIKKVCNKSSSIDIEEIFENKMNNDNKEKKFELALLPIDPRSSTN